MSKTKIEWCDFTVNPVKGLCPMACSYCYARAMYKRFKWDPEVRWEPEALLDLATVPEGSKVFIGSTFELFHPSVEQHMDYILDSVKRAPWQTSILLTKQPQNLIKFSPFPDNCWVGVTATNRAMLSSALFELRKVEAKVKYISIEPFLSRMYFECEQWEDGVKKVVLLDSLPKGFDELNWVIIGQQTPIRSATTPKIEWVREIVEACDKAGVPVSLKENMFKLIAEECPASQHDLFWEDLAHLRQEMPANKHPEKQDLVNLII